jgi:L-ascorbate metabolism protein UlaG (beta-lactamase superfamily)
MRGTRFFGLIFVCSMLAGAAFGKGMATNATQWVQLGQARQWLSQNPPNGTNAVERRKWMVPIQNACDQLSSSNYWDYVSTWGTRKAQADQLEKVTPALRYLHAASADAMAEIRHTQVRQGVAVWFLYNMGYVFKTPKACFGIDLFGRDVEKLAPDLDFLLISHEHGDHSVPPLIKAMVDKRKPVLTRWQAGTTIVTQGTNCQFGEVHVKVDIGDHGRGQKDQQNNMLMFEVDCGPSANGVVIYHSGDASNYEKMRPSKPVDIFIVHVGVGGMSVPKAIRHLKPKMTLVSHVLELGHSPTPPQAWRWSYDYAFNVIRDIPEKEATVLTWGERWLAPGTLLKGGDPRAASSAKQRRSW